MAGGEPGGEAPHPRQNTEKPSAQSKTLSRKELRMKWQETLSEEDLRNPDSRSAVRLAIDLGLEPGKAAQDYESLENQDRLDQARKFLEKEKKLREEEIGNLGNVSRINELLAKESLSEDEQKELFEHHAERLAQAEEALGIALGIDTHSLKLKIALLRAHYAEGISRKGRILRGEKEGDLYTSDQRRILMDAGLTGMLPPPPAPPPPPAGGLPIPGGPGSPFAGTGFTPEQMAAYGQALDAETRIRQRTRAEVERYNLLHDGERRREYFFEI